MFSKKTSIWITLRTYGWWICLKAKCSKLRESSRPLQTHIVSPRDIRSTSWRTLSSIIWNPFFSYIMIHLACAWISHTHDERQKREKRLCGSHYSQHNDRVRQSSEWQWHHRVKRSMLLNSRAGFLAYFKENNKNWKQIIQWRCKCHNLTIKGAYDLKVPGNHIVCAFVS